MNDDADITLENDQPSEEIALDMDSDIDMVTNDEQTGDDIDLESGGLDDLEAISEDEFTNIEESEEESEISLEEEELNFSEDEIAPALEATESSEEMVDIKEAIANQFKEDESGNGDDAKSSRDTKNIEQIESSSETPPKKGLASGFINHSITRIQMSSDYKESIKHASEGLIKAGSVFGLFIKEENSFEPLSMWQGKTQISKPSAEDLENYSIEIGATKDNISDSWSEFKLIVDQYSNYHPITCKVTSGTAVLYVIAYFEENELEEFILNGTASIIKALKDKF
jgi:hypothetical protein